jgi:uncharacterized protein YyaL (SSP411 family)
MNRLAGERSPYLLQHAHNPVDWFPWGEEAFERARAADKPIFLSIGYSTCHWCHVMERESFEDEAIAGVLNEHFVPVKVDREERPDVDRVYMTFVQGTTGSGGWPMSVWLTPDLQPFFGGTYFPPSSRWGRPGFADILREIARAWRTDRAQVVESAAAVTRELKALDRGSTAAETPGPEALARTVAQLQHSYDARHGGFGGAPKFPRPSELLFLLREHARTGASGGSAGGPAPLDMVLGTLRAIAYGGMRDHIGGGFHRYSVDAAWRVPHFEKMLYDQAQLAIAYVEAAQASGDRFYLDVAEDTLRYVMREMTDEGGGFYSAEDADSVPPESHGGGAHKAEGAFYLWTAAEIDDLLGVDAALVKRHFGIEPAGNAPIDPQNEFAGKNLLYIARPVDALGAEAGRPLDAVAEALGAARLRMFEARLERPRPHLDDKVLTAWNGLTIAAFARAARAVAAWSTEGRAAGKPYLDAAVRAAAFIRERMWLPSTGTLLRRYRGGAAEIEAYAEDYAFLIFGLLEILQADADPRWLEWATALQRRQDELFWDEAEGGWFSTTGRDRSVLLRLKEDYDGAEPTASSIAVVNLLVLSHLVDDGGWAERIERTLRLFGTRLEQAGRAVPMMAAALSAYVAGPQQIVITDGEGSEAFERAVARRYLPFATTLPPRESQGALAASAPVLAAMRPVDGRAAAYVCRQFACQPAALSVEELDARLRG